MDRVKHIDIAKGISISLVVLFHSPLSSYVPYVVEHTALFRMPLFFFLSGVFFSWNASPKKFLLHKSESLLKPYFSVLMTVFIVSLLSGEEHLLWQFKGMFYGNGDTIKWVPLWFLSHLFAVYCFCYGLFKFTSISKLGLRKMCLFALALCLLGSYWIDWFWYRELHLFSRSIVLPGLPFSVDILLISSAYFILGSTLSSKVINFAPNTWVLGLSCAGFFLISQFTDAGIDLNKRVCCFPIYASLAACCGLYIVLSISHFVSKSTCLSRVPISLGEASLFVLIFHMFISKVSFDYLTSQVNDESALIYLSILCFVLSTGLPVLIKKGVEHSDLISLAFLPLKSNKLIQRLR